MSNKSLQVRFDPSEWSTLNALATRIGARSLPEAIRHILRYCSAQPQLPSVRLPCITQPPSVVTQATSPKKVGRPLPTTLAIQDDGLTEKEILQVKLSTLVDKRYSETSPLSESEATALDTEIGGLEDRLDSLK